MPVSAESTTELLVVVVHRRLRRRDHARAHLHALGAEHERGRHRCGRRRCHRRRSPARRPASTPAGAAPSTRRRVRLLNPPPSPPSATMPSTPASIAFSARGRLGTTWNTVMPASCKRVGEAVRVAGRRGDEPHALVVHEVDDAGIAHEQLRDVHPERLVGEVAHLRDLVAHLVELARRRLDDPERARVRHRRRQLRPGDVAHRRLDDRVLDPEQFGDPVQHLAHATGTPRPDVQVAGRARRVTFA